MNFVGNVTILDRGDAPAQAVLDRNARSLAQRIADETKEELSEVMKRVDHVSIASMNEFGLVLFFLGPFHLRFKQSTEKGLTGKNLCKGCRGVRVKNT